MNESATIAMAQRARDLSAKGHDVINLSIGQPDFDTPDHIKEAAIEALRQGHTKYTPVPGLVELREAISKKFKRDNQLEYAANQIVISNGAKQGIANVALALLQAGDEVLLPTPYWVSYSEIIKMTGAQVVEISSGVEADYKITPAQLESAITTNSKMFIFSSPCNPSGSVYNEDELEALAEVFRRYEDIIVVSDEIYEYINFSDAHCSIGSLKDMQHRTVTVNGFSKGFAMTGWRLGYMGAPKWIADACSKIQGQFTSGATNFGQRAAITALNSDLEPTRKMCAAFLERRNKVVAGLRQIEALEVNEPQGAFYVFPEIDNLFGRNSSSGVINNADDFCEHLLSKYYVSVVSGSAFGNPKCMRISYASSLDVMMEAVARISKAVSELD